MFLLNNSKQNITSLALLVGTTVPALICIQFVNFRHMHLNAIIRDCSTFNAFINVLEHSIREATT